MLADLTIKGFLAEATGSVPVPGSGSISTLNGAIAAALTEVVVHLTIGKKKYAEVEGRMKMIATEAAIIRERLTEYIDENSKAYDRVFFTLKLLKKTSDEQAIRTNAVQSATRETVIVPMRMAEEIGSVMETIIYTTHKGNQNAITDVCVAMMAVRTCVLGTLLNVRTNLTSIRDEVFIGMMRKKTDELEMNVVRIEQKLLDWVKTKL